MNVLNPQETAALLPYMALAQELRTVLVDKRAGRAKAPPRLHVPLAEGGVLLLMPASDDKLAISKLVTVHPRNVEHGLPSVQVEVLVLEAGTGRRLLWLDGATVTARRTAALSLLAAQMLAPCPDGPLLIMGAGVQGRAHLEAFVEGLNLHQVYIASRGLERAEDLAAYARSLGVDARRVAHPVEVLDQVPLIVLATTSRTPVLPTDVRADALIMAVGAYQPDQAELPSALVQSAQIFVDTLEGTRAGAGDLIQAGVDWSHVTPLEEVIPGERVTLTARGPVVFKSVGHALWDLAAARLAWSRLQGMVTDR